MIKFMEIRPIKTTQALDAVHKLAQAEQQVLVYPTHTVSEKDYIIGAISILPVAFVWTAKEVKARQSKQIKEFIEGMVANQSQCVVFPCNDTCPYLPYMDERQGFLNVGKFNLFVKGLL